MRPIPHVWVQLPAVSAFCPIPRFRFTSSWGLINKLPSGQVPYGFPVVQCGDWLRWYTIGDRPTSISKRIGSTVTLLDILRSCLIHTLPCANHPIAVLSHYLDDPVSCHLWFPSFRTLVEYCEIFFGDWNSVLSASFQNRIRLVIFSRFLIKKISKVWYGWHESTSVLLRCGRSTCFWTDVQILVRSGLRKYRMFSVVKRLLSVHGGDEEVVCI